MFISNETPTGTIDWVNKVFTTSQNIDQIDDIWIDWAPYFNYTFIWNTVTLTDAPTVSIYIDYYTEAPTWEQDKFTVLEARELLERHIDDDLPEVSSQLFLDWLNHINQYTFRKLYRVDASQFRLKWIINVVQNTNSYTLPSWFRDITTTWTWFYKVDNNWNTTSDKLVPTWIWALEEWYYLEWSNVVFTPIPWTDTTYHLYYIPKLAILNDDSQNLVIDKEYQDYLVKALKMTYYDFINDQWNEVFTSSKFEWLLTEYLEYFRKSPKVYQTLNILTAY